MFGNRRLAKRSILGTRICASCQDGRYYSGVITAQKPGQSSEERDLIFTVAFENGTYGNYLGKDLVGHGFKQVSDLYLKPGQKVFLTLNGREICGAVTIHQLENDEVHISLVLPNGEEVTVLRKIDEIRLMESRKSARLIDQDTDYSKLADLHSEPKRRAVSHVIDVPSKVSRVRHSTSSSTGDSNHDDTEMMDDHMAAMVLTSLSVSPVSPVFPQSPDSMRDLKPYSRSFTDSNFPNSYTSSGFLSSTCRSDRSDPSPPLSAPLSESAPSPSASYLIGGIDEGIDLEENVNARIDQNQEMKVEQKQRSKKTMFKCTFPRCGKMFNTCPAVEEHVRLNHLEIKEDASDQSDHEEEFYYTEIEVTVENVTKAFSDMSTSSSPTLASQLEQFMNKPAISDHDYQRKAYHDHAPLESTSFPSANEFFGQATSTPIPINISQVKRSLSWQNTTGFSGSPLSPLSRSSRPSPQERLQQHQAQSPKTTMSSSPKSLSQYKKPRSDVRKCRKVYGMENRDLWCTQCKWKKACTRFME